MPAPQLPQRQDNWHVHAHSPIAVEGTIRWYASSSDAYDLLTNSDGCLDISCELWKAGAGGALEKLPTTVTFSFLNLAQDADVGRLAEEEALSQAKEGLDQMASPSVVEAILRVDELAAQAVDDVESFGRIWDSVLNKLAIFTKMTEVISEVKLLAWRLSSHYSSIPLNLQIHPYAQIACSVLSAVPKVSIPVLSRDMY